MEYTARTPEQLGKILKDCRTRHGRTQTDTGTKTGLKQTTVSTLENRTGRSHVESLYKLLSSLDLELVIRDRTGRPTTRPTKTDW